MNFTAREDYGLRAILELAMRQGETPLQSREIAQKQQIPEQFLEQLLGSLRRAGLVRSVRGASGGYLLARTASSITIAEVLETLSGPLVPIGCVSGDTSSCEHSASQGVHAFWERLSRSIHAVAEKMTVQDLVDEQYSSDAQASFMMNI